MNSGYTYDVFGRTTALPGSTIGYYTNDLVQQQTAGTQRQTWTLDSALRRRAFTTETNASGSWTQSASKLNHYDSDSDNPRWTVENTSTGALTRSVDGLDGNLAATTTKTGGTVLTLSNLHGDIALQLPADSGVAPSVLYVYADPLTKFDLDGRWCMFGHNRRGGCRGAAAARGNRTCRRLCRYGISHNFCTRRCSRSGLGASYYKGYFSGAAYGVFGASSWAGTGAPPVGDTTVPPAGTGRIAGGGADRPASYCGLTSVCVRAADQTAPTEAAFREPGPCRPNRSSLRLRDPLLPPSAERLGTGVPPDRPRLRGPCHGRPQDAQSRASADGKHRAPPGQPQQRRLTCPSSRRSTPVSVASTDYPVGQWVRGAGQPGKFTRGFRRRSRLRSRHRGLRRPRFWNSRWRVSHPPSSRRPYSTLDSAGERFHRCIGMLRVAGRPVCVRLDVPEDFLLREGTEIGGDQADDVVREFAKAKAIVT